MMLALIIGLGLSGRAAAKLLLQRSISVLGVDKSDEVLASVDFPAQHESVALNWQEINFVVLSPGISPNHFLCVEARNRGIEILGEVELAFRYLKTIHPMVAVTGTNGKTTVALLTEHVLNACGIKAKAVGNVGHSLCECLDDDRALIVELSSFQLESLHAQVFDVAVILNITPDHLDRYPDMEAYAKAKCHLQECLKPDGLLFIHEDVAKEYSHLLKNYQIYSCEGNFERDNKMAAWILCRPFNISREEFDRAAITFKKPAHRLEFVRTCRGVNYINDSKGTNVDAVIKAVESIQGPIILIVGGVDKGASYLLWEPSFRGKVKKLIAIGEAALKIYSELHNLFTVELAETLSAAVERASALAEKGDTVLLSPGCSSYDMFRNYAHRGEEFQAYVHVLKEG